MNRVSGVTLSEKFRQGSRIGRGWKIHAELGSNGLDAVPAFWGPHYAAERKATLILEILRHGDVCRHHEAFNDVLGHVVPGDSKVFDLAIFHDGRGLD